MVLLILGAVAYTLFSESAVRSRDSEAEASFRSMEGAWTLVEGDGTEHYTEEQKRFTLTVRPSDPSGLQRHPFELKGESTLGSFTLDDVDGGVMTGGLLTNDNYIPDDYGIYSIRAAPADDRRTLTMDLTYQVGDGTQKKRRFVFQKTAP